METQWVSIREDRPALGQAVLVFESASRDYNAPMVDTMRIATYQGQEGFSYTDGRAGKHYAENVTHWLPLPPAPVL